MVAPKQKPQKRPREIDCKTATLMRDVNREIEQHAAMLADLKEQTKEAKAQYDSAVMRLRKLVSDSTEDNLFNADTEGGDEE